jgi:hypothetical protein
MEKMKFIGGVDFEELKAQRIQVYNVITIDLATARTDQAFTFTGNYLYALDATDITSTLSVRLNEKFRGLLPLVKGRAVRAPFYRLYVTNSAQAGKTLTLALGVESDTFEVFDVGKALDISGSLSEVELLTQDDSWLFNSNAEKAFHGDKYVTTGSAWHQYAGLFNPAASGVVAYVKRFLFRNITSAGVNSIRTHNASLGNDVSGPNKYMGKTVSVCKMNHTASPTVFGTEIRTVYAGVNEWHEMIEHDPIIIPTGTNLLFRNQASVAGTIQLILEWEER